MDGALSPYRALSPADGEIARVQSPPSVSPRLRFAVMLAVSLFLARVFHMGGWRQRVAPRGGHGMDRNDLSGMMDAHVQPDPNMCGGLIIPNNMDDGERDSWWSPYEPNRTSDDLTVKQHGGRKCSQNNPHNMTAKTHGDMNSNRLSSTDFHHSPKFHIPPLPAPECCVCHTTDTQPNGWRKCSQNNPHNMSAKTYDDMNSNRLSSTDFHHSPKFHIPPLPTPVCCGCHHDALAILLLQLHKQLSSLASAVREFDHLDRYAGDVRTSGAVQWDRGSAAGE